MENVEKLNKQLWERIVKANKEIKTMNLKGKRYAPVNERIIAFRKVYPNGDIYTEASFTDNYIMVKATVYDDTGTRLGTGYARELANRPFALEVAESSAIGRCIGIATGLGISTSLSSFDDMKTYQDNQIFDDEEMEKQNKLQEEAIAKFNKLSVSQKADILNLFKVATPDLIDTKTLIQLVNNAK